MANTLGVYNPIFYAQEGLIWLTKALGMAGRVHRGYSKMPTEKGKTISVRAPSTFTAQDAPSSAQDLSTTSVDITLDQWKEVKFSLTDQELSYTQDDIIREHIMPAAYALADKIDSTLALEYKNVPWLYDVASDNAPVVADVLGARRVLFDNRVPLDIPGNVHLMVDGNHEAGLLGQSAFSQWQGAGQAGVETQLRGSLGTRFGMEIFANQNVQTHTKGTASTGTLAVNGAHAAGVTTIALDAGSVTGTLVAGDTFVIAGNTQRYSVTGTATASGNAFAAVTFTPPLAAAAADNAVVTVSLDNHSAMLAFHKDFAALAFAPLSDMANNLGAQVATVIDPVSSIALRSRIFYVGDSSAIKVALDCLYGIKTLNPNLACRLRGA